MPEALRLAERLETSITSLSDAEGSTQWEPDSGDATEITVAGRELEDFFSSVERVIRAMSNASGAQPMHPKSKLAILNGIEEAARQQGQKLPAEFWRLRQAIVEGG